VTWAPQVSADVVTDVPPFPVPGPPPPAVPLLDWPAGPPTPLIWPVQASVNERHAAAKVAEREMKTSPREDMRDLLARSDVGRNDLRAQASAVSDA